MRDAPTASPQRTELKQLNLTHLGLEASILLQIPIEFITFNMSVVYFHLNNDLL